MRLVIARCSVDYIGRLTAHLPMATRLLMVKADGSVSIHADDRAYKPLNWMSPPCRLQEAPGVWKVVNKAGAASQLGLTDLVRAAPDGHTLSYVVLPTVTTHYLVPGREAI